MSDQPDDRLLSLAEAATFFPGRRSGEHVSVENLRKIAKAQNGVYARCPYSAAALQSYPRFFKGPGGRYVTWLSVVLSCRKRYDSPPAVVLEQAERFRRKAS